MPKLLAWIVRLALLLLTPLFLFCSGVARSMMWLDAWAVDQLRAELRLAQRGTLDPWASTERSDR